MSDELRTEVVLAPVIDIDDAKLEKIIAGALRSTINVHGPITKNLLSSAAKRVRGEVKAEVRRQIESR